MALAVIASLGPASPSYADDSGPSVRVYQQSGDPGILVATVMSVEPVTSVAVHISGASGFAEDDSLHLADGTTTDGTWQTDRVSLATYAEYQLTATATDDLGTQGTGNQFLEYYPWGAVDDLAVTPSTLDYEHPSFTASGTLLQRDPRIGVSTATSGVPVGMSIAGGGEVTSGDSNESGQFSLEYKPTSLELNGTTSFFFSLYRKADGVAPVDQSLLNFPVSVGQNPVRLTLDSTTQALDEGQSFPLTGHAEYESAGVWHPLAGATVGLGDSIQSPTTVRSDGSFTLTAKAGDHASDYWVTFDPVASPNGRLLEYAISNSIRVTPRLKTQRSWSSFTLHPDWSLTVDGDLEIRSSAKNIGASTVYLERSDDGKNGWTALASFRTKTTGYFAYDVPIAEPSGYWRLRYLGSGMTYGASTSAVKHGTLAEARVIHFDAGPEPVKKGHKITVVGDVQKQSGSAWAPLAEKTVSYYFRAHGATTYVLKGTSKSSAHGHFRKTFKASKDGYWAVVWWRTSTAYTNAYSDGDYVNVK